MSTLRTAGIAVLALGAVVSGVRCALTLSWLPRSAAAVVSFAATELFLIPLGILYLTLALVLRFLEGRSACDLKAAMVVVLAVFPVLLSAWAFFPCLSQRLEWGRYGFQPPVRLRSLDPITRDLGLRLPEDTELVEGEFIAGPGPGEYLFAVLEMSAASAKRFLDDEPLRLRRGSLPSARDLPIPLPAKVLRSVVGRPSVVYIGVSLPENTDMCDVVVDLSDPARAVVYLYCVPTI
jgi:hypothetical protein